MASVLCKDNEESKKKVEADLANKDAEAEAEKMKTKKLASIIIGKLYMMQNEIVEGPVAYNEEQPAQTME